MSLHGKKGQRITARLKHQLVLQTPVLSSDVAGGNSVSWSVVDTVWAEIKTRSSGDERSFAGKLQAEHSFYVLIRYRSDVSAQMRLLYGGRALNIRRVVNVDEADVLLELLVEEGVAQ